MTFRDPSFAIAMTIILLFAAAYWRTPTQKMAGALIAAFSGASGYFLGSSSGAARNTDNASKALDLAAAAAPAQPATVRQPGEAAVAAPAPIQGA